MKRREFIGLLGGAAVTPIIGAREGFGQQPKPVVGYLHLASPTSFGRFAAAFKAALREGGYVEGANVEIEYRWAEGQADRLPALAADLVHRKVRVIATGGAERPIRAAKAATSTIPIVFVLGSDPIKMGIVANVARPTGNVTGIHMLTPALESKRFGLLHEMLPKAKTIAALIDTNRDISKTQIEEVRAAAAQAGVKLVIIPASKEADFVPAFTQMAAERVDALQICANPFFMARRQQLVTLAAHNRVPTMHDFREFAEAGGLMSYGTDLADAYRQSGLYVARILNGATPSDLPVMQTTKFEFVINLVTAKALGVEIAPTLLARADAVIE
jgi:putative tryptophan/tyrosine transport system substrate-binding protein